MTRFEVITTGIKNTRYNGHASRLSPSMQSSPFGCRGFQYSVRSSNNEEKKNISFEQKRGLVDWTEDIQPIDVHKKERTGLPVGHYVLGHRPVKEKNQHCRCHGDETKEVAGVAVWTRTRENV